MVRLLGLLVFLCFFCFSCSTSTVVNEQENTIISKKETEYDEEEVECEEEGVPCETLSYWVDDAYISSDFQETVYLAKQAIACDCGVTNASSIYSNLAKAYVELGEDKKASKTIKKGLSYDSENLELIQLAVWNANRLKDIEVEISYLELLLTIKKEARFFEQLANVYRREKKYNDQIRVIKEWLKNDPENDKANAELKLAFQKTGRDEFEIDKERCEKNPNNFDICFNYAKNLSNSARYNDALSVLNEMKKKNPKNEKLLKEIAEVYLNNYDQEEALNTYKKLVRINSNNALYALEISKIYQDQEKYAQAYKFAKKALRMSGTGDYNKKSIVNLAELFKNCVESCSKELLSLEDKAVYEISYKYYKEAYKKGHKESKNMIGWFKDNKKTILPTLEDWFLIDSDLSELTPIDINPKNSCYSWIEEKVSKIE